MKAVFWPLVKEVTIFYDTVINLNTNDVWVQFGLSMEDEDFTKTLLCLTFRGPQSQYTGSTNDRHFIHGQSIILQLTYLFYPNQVGS